MPAPPSISPPPQPQQKPALRERSNSVANAAHHHPSRGLKVTQKRCLTCSSLTQCSCPTGHHLDPEEKKRRLQALEAHTDYGKRKIAMVLGEVVREESKARTLIVREEAAANEIFVVEMHQEQHCRTVIEQEEASAVQWVTKWKDTFLACMTESRLLSSQYTAKVSSLSSQLLQEHQHYLDEIADALEDMLQSEKQARMQINEMVYDEDQYRAKIITESDRYFHVLWTSEIPSSIEMCRAAERAKIRCREDMESAHLEEARHIMTEESTDRQTIYSSFEVELGQRRSWVNAKANERQEFENECAADRAAISTARTNYLDQLALDECCEREDIISRQCHQERERAAIENSALTTFGACRSEEGDQWHTLINLFDEEGSARLRWEGTRREERQCVEVEAEAQYLSSFNETVRRSQECFNQLREHLHKYQADLSARLMGLQFAEEGDRRSLVSLESDAFEALRECEQSGLVRVREFTFNRLLLNVESREQITRSSLVHMEEDDYKSLLTLFSVAGQDAVAYRLANIRERITKLQNTEKKSRSEILEDQLHDRATIAANFKESMPQPAETAETRMLRQFVVSQLYPKFEGYDAEYVETGRIRADTIPTPAPYQGASEGALVAMQRLLHSADDMYNRAMSQIATADIQLQKICKVNTKLRTTKELLLVKKEWGMDMRRKAEERLATTKANTKQSRMQSRNNLKMTRERAASSKAQLIKAKEDLESLRDRVRERMRGPSKSDVIGKKRQR